MKTKTLLSALVLSAAAAVPATSMAGASANIGWVSDYLFRGVFQSSSSAYAGVDYSTDSGFYIGNWDAQVGKGFDGTVTNKGLESDLYFGYSAGDKVTWKVGYTGYFYSDDFDDTYNEINLGVGYGIFALDVAVGKWDGFGSKQDYTFTSITITPEKGPYYKVGGFSQDFSGSYFELGYTHHLEDLDVDLSLAWDHSSDLNVSGSGTADNAIVFGIKKNITLGK
jgi:uncharacterized protein (TIGR02001 family)